MWEISTSKVQTHRSYSQKNFLWVLLKCIIVTDIYEHVQHKIQGSIILENKLAEGNFFGGKLTTVTFVKVLCPMIVKCLNEKKALQRIIIRFFNFGPNWNNIGGFSPMGQGIGKSPALAKNLLILFPTTKKNPPISRLFLQIFIPLH